MTMHRITADGGGLALPRFRARGRGKAVTVSPAKSVLPSVLVVANSTALTHNDKYQIAQLRQTWREEHASVSVFHPDIGITDEQTFTHPAGRLSSIRALCRLIPHCDVVHVISAEDSPLAEGTLLPVLLGRFFGRRVIFDCRSLLAEVNLDSVSPLTHQVLGACHGIVVHSAYQAAVFARCGLKAHVLGQAVRDVSEISPGRIQPRIYVADPLHEYSGLATILKAFSLIKGKYPRAELVMRGTEASRPDIEQNLSGIDRNGIEVLGPSSPGDSAERFAGADIFLNAATDGDTPVSLTEAMAAGIPVVTTPTGGGREIITDGKTGLFTSAERPAQMAQRVCDLIESPELSRQLSEGGRSRAGQFSWTRVQGRWLDFYRR